MPSPVWPALSGPARRQAPASETEAYCERGKTQVSNERVLNLHLFQQGADLVNAYDAVYSTASACANKGLNMANDLAGVEHYGGSARWDPNTGEYYVVDESGTLIGDGYVWSGATMATNTWVPQE